MIDKLIGASIRNRGIVVAVALGLLVWGGYVVTVTQVDVFPDLTAPTVTILVEGRGMVPTEMESLVTFPIEASMNGASGVRRVRSATAVGVAIIWVEFDWNVDIHRARQVVAEKLALTAGALPPGVEPVLAPISSIMGEILFLALESDRHSPLDLRTTADTVLRRRLMAVPGCLPGDTHRGRREAVPDSAEPGPDVGTQHQPAGGRIGVARREPERVGGLRCARRRGNPHPGHRPCLNLRADRFDPGCRARRATGQDRRRSRRLASARRSSAAKDPTMANPR